MHITKDTTKQVKQWLTSNGFNVGCRLGNDFYYEPEQNYIAMASNYDSTYDEDFMKCLRKNGLASNYDAITLSILHELGHFATLPMFSAEEWELDSIEKDTLRYTCKSQRRLNFAYWATPTEFAANNWAIMYCKIFPNKVDELEEIVSRIYWE